MNKFNFGDLVRVAGYFPRVFQVDGYRTEHWHYPEEEWTDMVYELHDVQTGDWLEADEEDLSIVVPAIMAKDYIAYRLVQNDSDGWPDTYEKEAVKMAKEPRKLTARELSAQRAERRKKERKEREAKVNALLDELNDYKALADKFGDEAYKARVDYLTLKLAELMTK